MGLLSLVIIKSSNWKPPMPAVLLFCSVSETMLLRLLYANFECELRNVVCNPKDIFFFSLFLTKPWKNFYRKLIVLPNVQCAGSSSGCLNTLEQTNKKQQHTILAVLFYGVSKRALLWLLYSDFECELRGYFSENLGRTSIDN